MLHVLHGTYGMRKNDARVIIYRIAVSPHAYEPLLHTLLAQLVFFECYPAGTGYAGKVSPGCYVHTCNLH